MPFTLTEQEEYELRGYQQELRKRRGVLNVARAKYAAELINVRRRLEGVRERFRDESGERGGPTRQLGDCKAINSLLSQWSDDIAMQNKFDPVDALDRFISRSSSARYQHLRLVRHHDMEGVTDPAAGATSSRS